MSGAAGLPLVPFNRAALAGKELEYIAQAVARGHISGGGTFTRSAEDLLAKVSGSARVLMATSCTHALELSARILRLGPGDEVIVPAYTFVSTAAAFALTGARPVFVDVNDQTLNLDIDATQAAITDRTRAICTVHYAGIGDRVDDLVQLCDSHGITMIEDNAHGLGASFKGRKLGTFGRMSTLSFHETKNITCGEGGALALNDPSLVDLAEVFREKGTDRSRFLRGQVDKYTWVEVGSSWVASDLLAAFLVAQLQSFEEIQRRRMAVWMAYDAALGDWARESSVRTPVISEGASHPAHMYFLRLPSLTERTAFIEHLRSLGIMAVFHYQALNTSAVGRSFGGRSGQCPVSEGAADTLVRLPLFADMRPDELDRVIEAVLSFRS